MSVYKNEFNWTGRTDTEDGEAGSRWHQKVKKDGVKDGIKDGIALVGFACDLGVINNKGRPGANEGPDAIRSALANLAWHHDKPVLDAGTVFAGDKSVAEDDGFAIDSLEKAQMAYAQKITQQLQQQEFVVGLGGGHEIAWGSYNGLLNALPNKSKKTSKTSSKNTSKSKPQTIGILNFDAHFDLRKPAPAHAPKNSSGTPFYQIAQDCEKHGREFKYACLGVAETANTKALFDVADRYNVRYLKDLDCQLDSQSDGQLRTSKALLTEFLADVDELYVTICLDVFHASHAPGVSAPSALGISPNYVIQLLHWLSEQKQTLNFNWRLTDIAEMSPKYDIDGHTAKLAARLVWEVCRG